MSEPSSSPELKICDDSISPNISFSPEVNKIQSLSVNDQQPLSVKKKLSLTNLFSPPSSPCTSPVTTQREKTPPLGSITPNLISPIPATPVQQPKQLKPSNSAKKIKLESLDSSISSTIQGTAELLNTPRGRNESTQVRILVNFGDGKDRLVQFVRIKETYSVRELLGQLYVSPIPVSAENVELTVNPAPGIDYRLKFKDCGGYFSSSNLKKPLVSKEMKEKKLKPTKEPKVLKPEKKVKKNRNETKEKLKEIAPELFEIPTLAKLMRDVKPEMIEAALKPIPPEQKYHGFFPPDASTTKKDSQTSNSQPNLLKNKQAKHSKGTKPSSTDLERLKNLNLDNDLEPTSSRKLRSDSVKQSKEGIGSVGEPKPGTSVQKPEEQKSNPRKRSLPAQLEPVSNMFNKELPPGTFADLSHQKPNRYPNVGPAWYRTSAFQERFLPHKQLKETLPCCGNPFDSSMYSDQMIVCSECGCRTYIPGSDSSAEEYVPSEEESSYESSSGSEIVDSSSEDEADVPNLNK